MPIPRAELARMIDHSALSADTSASAIEDACRVGRDHGVASVCVMPAWTQRAAKLLDGSDALVGGTIGFPLGGNLIAIKALEARLSIELGAGEIDFVMNVGAAKSGDWTTVEKDAREVVLSVRSMEEEKQREIACKMILECCCLTDDEKRRACAAALSAGADFVKASTGFGHGGATVEDVALLRATVGPGPGVKAAGGIRTLDGALAMIEAGATRIGTSATVAILNSIA